jgi:hypothetical protein
MKLPEDKEIYRTEIAEFWFTDDGILNCNALPVERTIENINESFSLVEKISGGKRLCLITDLSNTGVQKKKERDFATEHLARYYKAMAVISESEFGKSIANIFLMIYNLPIPVKLFTKENEAREWISKFL